MKKRIGGIVLAWFVGLGLTQVAQAQSLDASREIGPVRFAHISPDGLPPLFAKMTAPPGAIGWPPLRQPAARGAVLPTFYAGLIALQAYDGYSTSEGLKKGAVESNGLMTVFVRHPASLWAVKGGVAFASIYVAERLWRTHRRGEAIALMVATNALMVGVAANNAAIVRGLK